MRMYFRFYEPKLE